MASKTIASTTFLLAINLLFFTLVTSTYCPPPPSPKPKSPPHSSPPKTPATPKTPPAPKTPATPTVPKTPATPPTVATCPRDALKLGVCANVLSGLLKPVIGTPPDKQCCPLLSGLADLEAAVCLCTAIKANVLGLNLNIPVDLSLLLNYCGKKVPSGFKCS